MSRRCGLHRDVAARFAIATLLAFLFGTEAARSANLTGMWSYSLVTTGDGRDPMGTVSILQSGATVTGDWAEVDPKKEQAFGFEKGERVLEGTIDGARLKGRLRLHYPIANRAACPDGWQTWGDIDIALPKTADLLQGEFMSSEINPADCTTKESGWRSFEFVRAVPSESGGTENSTSTEKPPTEETPETPVAGTPSRIDIALDEVSASPGQGLMLQVLLRNDADRRVTADKLYRIRISAENAQVSPDSVEIREGESAAAARVVGERPGDVPIHAASVEDDLKEGKATAITCGSDPITHVVLNAESEEATVGTPIKAVVSLQNDQGVEVAGGGGNKRVRVEVKGVGRFANPGHDLIEEGRCATTLRIDATRAGTSPVTVSLAALPSEARTFRFVLPVANLAAALLIGGLVGSLARALQNWKNSRRWKIGRWLTTLAVGLIAGVAVYLIYGLGLVEALPELPLGYGPALLLSIVGGYLGPIALERVSNRILPA